MIKRHETDNSIANDLYEIRHKLYNMRAIKSDMRAKRDAVDNLIYEVVADGERDAIERDYDKSRTKADFVNHKLNERIERVNQVLIHLKDISKHFDKVHKMADSLVDSDATANFVKKFAIEQLNDSVNKIENCESCWQ